MGHSLEYYKRERREEEAEAYRQKDLQALNERHERWKMMYQPKMYIPKSELVHGEYYSGSCRNSSIARWSATRNIFLYMRSKFGDYFVDEIDHPEDNRGYDLFYPTAIAVPETNQIVQDENL